MGGACQTHHTSAGIPGAKGGEEGREEEGCEEEGWEEEKN